MKKLIFSSDDLPPTLGDQARFDAWRDIYLGTICHFDVARLSDRPFSTYYEFLQIGEIGVSRCDGTVDRIRRTRHHLASDPHDSLFISINGDRPWIMESRGRAHRFAPHSVSLLSNADASEAHHAGGGAWQGLVLPRTRVQELVQSPDDLVGHTFDPNSDVTRYLKRFVEMLLGPGDLGADAALAGHIETTLLDLVTLALNGHRDAVELSRLRGLRAARLQDVLAQIKARFSDPAFSPQAVATRLGFSVNYVQKLLYETGATFTDRVLELRVQKGRAMLMDRRNDHLKISDIALACGFNEVSYFNRCFRRRFGASPTQFRGSAKN